MATPHWSSRTGQNTTVPSSDKLRAIYLIRVTKIINQVMFPHVARLMAQPQALGNLPGMGKLGIRCIDGSQPNKAKTDSVLTERYLSVALRAPTERARADDIQTGRRKILSNGE